VEFPVGVFATSDHAWVACMSSDDSSTFPEFLPLGLIVKPCGGIKAEPQDVKIEEDLPRRFMFGCLQKSSFKKTEGGWSASYRHPTSETGAEVVYNDVLKVNFSWRGEKWMVVAPEQTFTDVRLCIYPESLDNAMKERLEERYNLAYSIPNEKIGRDCYFPDGPSRCIVCPIRVSSLGTARKALHAMKQDEAIVAPLFAFAVMGLSVIDYNLQVAPSNVLDPLFPILGPLFATGLPAAGEAKRHRSEDGTDALRVPRRQYFAAFQTFFCDLERVAQWLHAFQLLGIAPDESRHEEWLDFIEHRSFVCQGPELAAVTIEYRENKMGQVAFSIRLDTSKLVSVTDSDAKIDEMIHAVQRKSLALQDEVESELRGD
jgi:hypothetical protein